MGRGEIARYEQFLFFPQCYSKTYIANQGLVRERDHTNRLSSRSRYVFDLVCCQCALWGGVRVWCRSRLDCPKREVCSLIYFLSHLILTCDQKSAAKATRKFLQTFRTLEFIMIDSLYGVKDGYLDFSLLSELKSKYITEIYMKKQYKSSRIKNHKITFFFSMVFP